MTTKTKFVSASGREFDDPKRAMFDDLLFGEQNRVSKILPQAIDDHGEFSNGGGYVQHTQDEIGAFIIGLRQIIEMEFGPNSETLKHFDAAPTGFVGRYLDDSGSNTYRLWSRLANIDSELREWGQGYYALHPSKGKQVPWPTVASSGMEFYD